MSGNLNVTRDQLAKFIEDHNTIRQFEKLFSLFSSLTLNAEGEVVIDPVVDPVAIFVSAESSQEVSIETVEKLVTIPDTVLTSLDLTITAGAGINALNYILIKNKSAVNQNIWDSTKKYMIEPGQLVKFRLDGTELIWASANWEIVYDEPTNTGVVLGSSFNRGVTIGGYYRHSSAWSGVDNMILTEGIASNTSSGRTVSNAISDSAYYTYNSSEWARGASQMQMRKAWLWHNGE